MSTTHRSLVVRSAIAILCAAGLALSQAPPKEGRDQSVSNYVLGPDDQVTIQVLDLKEIDDKPFRIDMRGNISVPLAGRVHAAGMTAEQLEADLARRLDSFLQTPTVSVTVSEFRSQPVSVLGAVNTPGIHQIQGRKTLFEILSLAGGLRNEAGNTIKITRRKEWGDIPLPTAITDPTGQFSVAEVSVASVMEAKNPQENILIQPNDVISVPRAKLVYVTGAVRRSGGFVLNEKETMSVIQALSLAEGLDQTAGAQNAKILRGSGTPNRAEIPVDVKKILSGKGEDVSLQANDILFIPTSAAKNATLRALEAAIQLGTGVVIYRR